MKPCDLCTQPSAVNRVWITPGGTVDAHLCKGHRYNTPDDYAQRLHYLALIQRIDWTGSEASDKLKAQLEQAFGETP